MEGTITRQEHEEFARRMDVENKRLAEEDTRQNRRIAELEEKVGEIHNLALSMERMSANVEKMAEAIERQGNLIEKQTCRIDEIEREPAKEQKEIKMEVVKTIISALAGAAVVAVIALL